MAEINLTAFLQQHGAVVDADNRLTLQVLCDGTYIFLYEMLQVLCALECTDIQYDGSDAADEAPQDKPWCNWKFTASGRLPDHLYFDGTMMYKKTAKDGRDICPSCTKKSKQNAL